MNIPLTLTTYAKNKRKNQFNINKHRIIGNNLHMLKIEITEKN